MFRDSPKAAVRGGPPIGLDARSKTVHGGMWLQVGVQKNGRGARLRQIKKRTDVLPASAGNTYGLITICPGLCLGTEELDQQ